MGAQWFGLRPGKLPQVSVSADRNGKGRWRQRSNLRQFLAKKKKEQTKLKSLQGKSGLEHVWPRATLGEHLLPSSLGRGWVCWPCSSREPCLRQHLAWVPRKASSGAQKCPHSHRHVALGSRLRPSSCTSGVSWVEWKEGGGGVATAPGLGPLPVLVVPAVVHRGWWRGLLGDLGPAHPPTPPRRCCR